MNSSPPGRIWDNFRGEFGANGTVHTAQAGLGRTGMGFSATAAVFRHNAVESEAGEALS